MKKALPRGLHVHFDPESGIAGDMTVAALVDAGVPQEVVTGAVDAMGVPGLRTAFEARQRGAYAGTGFIVRWPGQGDGRSTLTPVDAHRNARAPLLAPAGKADPHAHGHIPHSHEHAHPHEHPHAHPYEHAHPHEHVDGAGDFAARPHGHTHGEAHAHGAGHDHRPYAEIKRLLHRAGLDGETRALAEEIFARVAEVEAALHGTSADEVTFHEIGAYDSIADIVGAAAAIAHLAPASVSAAPPVVGTGTVRTAHGPVAVPAPATAALLFGAPIRAEGQGELTTPTGAALLAVLVDHYGPMPPGRLIAQGFGAGTKELSDRANVLRVLLSEPLGRPLPTAAPTVRLLQANIDDMNPQLVEPLMEALFEAGALDAWATPIVMKKGRPALEISALVEPSGTAAVERALFRNSTTIGVRSVEFGRTVLARSMVKVETRFGAVAVKLAVEGSQVIGATPEFDDCRQLAARAQVPVRLVLAAAAAAAATFLGEEQERISPR